MAKESKEHVKVVGSITSRPCNFLSQIVKKINIVPSVRVLVIYCDSYKDDYLE